jgi:sugar diacid utilization regulator
MTPAARRVSSAANSEQAVNATLSSVNAVFTLSLILTQASSPRQAVRLLTTAVPSIASCQKVLAWHPSRSGDYYERAPDGISNALARITVPARLERDESSSWWAFPFGPATADNPIFLVVSGTDPLSSEEKFLLSVLAQLCGTVIAKLELLAAERANTERVASLNTDLASTVSTLTKIMETHRRLNEIIANAGEAGIAKTLHQLTRFPVLIEDVHGNIRATAGDMPSGRRAKQPEKRQELIRQLQITRQALYHRGAWLVLANPRPGVLGVVVLLDPARTATETDLAALEYAATVLSVELARLQSVAEAELRSQRDFAEELLAGADEPTARASAHALGYDPERPHRVIIATGRPRDGLDEQFFQAVVREVRRLDVATLIVGRASYVVIIAYREADWAKLHAGITSQLPGSTCRLAVGSRYPNAWQVAASYREAQFAANLSSSTVGHPAPPVLLFDSLGVYRMLSSVTDPAGIEAFMNDQLGTLLDYDKQHRSGLLATLAQYLDCGCNIDQAAVALSIHRSTLKYRLKRVRELLGQDLNDGPTRLNLHLATRVWLTLESLRRTEQA